jgi:hypothetical protein
VKERANELLENKEIFLSFRNLIFGNLFERLKSYDQRVIDRICYSISVLMTIGIMTYWPECIQDMINYAKTSSDNCLFAMKILENIPKELFELNIANKYMLRIKDILQDHKAYIQEFIYLVITTNDVSINILTENLLLLKEWVKLSLNILKIPILSQSLLARLDSNNVATISEIFVESINYSPGAKYESVNEEYDVEKIYSSYDPEEIKSIEELVMSLKNIIVNRSNDIDIIDGCSNIFCALTENYMSLAFRVNYT